MTPHLFTLLTRPDKAWTDIRRDEASNSSNYLLHLLLCALLPAVCMFIGTRLVGWSLVEDERIRLDTRSALQLSVVIYLSIILGTFVMGWFLRWMSRSFEARPTFNQVRRLHRLRHHAVLPRRPRARYIRRAGLRWSC